MAIKDLKYSELPDMVKDNLSEDQFRMAFADIIEKGGRIPRTTQYINLESGVLQVYSEGETADGDLLPTHDLSGADDKNDTQFQS